MLLVLTVAPLGAAVGGALEASGADPVGRTVDVRGGPWTAGTVLGLVVAACLALLVVALVVRQRRRHRDRLLDTSLVVAGDVLAVVDRSGQQRSQVRLEPGVTLVVRSGESALERGPGWTELEVRRPEGSGRPDGLVATTVLATTVLSDRQHLDSLVHFLRSAGGAQVPVEVHDDRRWDAPSDELEARVPGTDESVWPRVLEFAPLLILEWAATWWVGSRAGVVVGAWFGLALVALSWECAVRIVRRHVLVNWLGVTRGGLLLVVSRGVARRVPVAHVAELSFEYQTPDLSRRNRARQPRVVVRTAQGTQVGTELAFASRRAQRSWLVEMASWFPGRTWQVGSRVKGDRPVSWSPAHSTRPPVR